MTDQEAADVLSKEYGRPVPLAEAAEINRDLTVLARMALDSYLDLKKKGLAGTMSEKAESDHK